MTPTEKEIRQFTTYNREDDMNTRKKQESTRIAFDVLLDLGYSREEALNLLKNPLSYESMYDWNLEEIRAELDLTKQKYSRLYRESTGDYNNIKVDYRDIETIMNYLNYTLIVIEEMEQSNE